MSIMPMTHRCENCKKYYQWNPDIGMFFCPKCNKNPVGLDVTGIIKVIKEIRTGIKGL